MGLFSGCGGLDLGFKRAGYQTIWANDIDPDACETYKKNVGEKIITGDIWQLLNKVPKADIVIGGPPCQAFSLVGKRLENDPRGRLVFAFSEIIERLNPRVFVMENVPGLAASEIDGKRLTQVLAKKFMRAGYEVKICKLTATDFFVPQKRSRIVMLGFRPKKSYKHQFLTQLEFSSVLGDKDLSAPVSAHEALDDLPPPSLEKFVELRSYKKMPHSPYARLMRQTSNGKVSLQVMPTMSDKDKEFVRHIKPGGNYMDIPNSVSTPRILKFKKSGGRTTTYGRLHPNRPAYTINTFFNRPNVGANYHYSEERLITPREALRLQSFHDSFEVVYRSQRSLHMQIGNAVPPLMARAIAESIKGYFKN
ncbi:MAG: DNA cytosine methyltransferase [Candidatus Omnitrophica bacterium]|nr:DNA cytosine methyltransferase [Candidatus Omnitrophota bacterium]